MFTRVPMRGALLTQAIVVHTDGYVAISPQRDQPSAIPGTSAVDGVQPPDARAAATVKARQLLCPS